MAVAYILGLVMRRAAELYPGEAKSDTRDSYVLANTARTHRAHLGWLEPTDTTLEELRVLSGYDDDLAADATRQANRLRDALTTLSPPLERVLGPRMQRLLKARAPRSADRLARDIWAALQAQTVTVATEGRLGQVIAELASELDRLHTRRERLAADIEAVFSVHPLGPVLASLPGIGPRTGAKILAEVGDGSRFASGGQLAAYAGLAPVTHQSGSSIRGESRSRAAAITG